MNLQLAARENIYKLRREKMISVDFSHVVNWSGTGNHFNHFHNGRRLRQKNVEIAKGIPAVLSINKSCVSSGRKRKKLQQSSQLYVKNNQLTRLNCEWKLLDFMNDLNIQVVVVKSNYIQIRAIWIWSQHANKSIYYCRFISWKCNFWLKIWLVGYYFQWHFKITVLNVKLK